MDDRPRLGFVGPLLGRNAGHVMSQGEVLAGLFAGAGYQVKLTSTYSSRLPRLLDTMASLFRWRHQVDIVIQSVFSGASFAVTDIASAIARRLRLPQVFVLRGGALPQFAQRNGRWVNRVLQRASALVTPSGYLSHRLGQSHRNVRIIPNVLALENYPYRLRSQLRPRLLWMRAFHDVYYPELAIATLEMVRQSRPEATLTMAGPDKGRLAATRALAERKGVAGSVTFPGFLDMAAKQQLFASHDIFLNTNRVDNMPVSVVEAAAFGLPVVATRVGGIPFLLESGENALLTRDGDAADMARAINQLLADPELASHLSASGRRLAETCSWPQVRAQWEQLLPSVLAHA